MPNGLGPDRDRPARRRVPLLDLLGLQKLHGRSRPLGLLALVGLLCACDGSSGKLPTPSRNGPPNVLLISVDTLRADHLGSYGYARNTSPNLDALAGESVRYANAVAPAPWTLPSHVSMLTGLHPYQAGVTDLKSQIAPGIRIVAEPLREAGYQTAAFVDSTRGSFVGADRGFDRGFDLYEHRPRGPDAFRKDDIASTVRAAHAWLEKRDPARPFFLFLHTKSVHSLLDKESKRAPAASPYDAPEPFRWQFNPLRKAKQIWRSGGKVGPRYLESMNRKLARGLTVRGPTSDESLFELIARYDGGIAWVDQQLGVLLGHLEALGLANDTIVIVTADHGEGFVDHRFFLHKELHREILHVPLLIRDPAQATAQVDEGLVSLEDITPTILARAGLSVPGELTGIALPREPSVRSPDDPPGRPPERRLYAAAKRAKGEFYEGLSLREGPWTLIRDRVSDGDFSVRLYDSRADPAELSPVEGERERAASMEKTLLAWFADAERSASGAPEMELDGATLDELKALGYIE